MTEGTGILLLLAIIWIGWPLSRIADHLGALRKLAERNRR
ncbi:hypothetical protein M527_29375 [Sphingobium indicum IP26]|nr:hypothetical protein M527_29375 [Sphingobium indicum IP26]EQB03705.1 hypothetical protein L286_11840 [Sphingobium sp. HDIP04]